MNRFIQYSLALSALSTLPSTTVLLPYYQKTWTVITMAFWMPTPAGCQFYNTDSDCPLNPEIPASLSITFDNAKTRSQMGNAPYNPYIFATFDRGREVHLPNHHPSSRVDQNRFGQGDDDSNLYDFSKTYKTSDSMPWALNMPYSWLHPTSGDNIVNVYADYRQWAESGGLTSSDWYTKNYNSNRVYIGE